ncbi:Zinc finger BED domain-containing protein 5 [Trichinella nelsoni]|uniref:Zinc finger BED domain-containing protein 5 n=1 Tax=Trichinella nelsoni TaxID=6336 RepID=A0A0V0RW83_9BILA|nr:Zinc finger BED domain-containing protein 5 [Trichinella nelsoni]
MIVDYNATKGGEMDNMDKMLATYACQGMTARVWPLEVFYNISDVYTNNSYLLWIHYNPEKRLPRALMSAHIVQKVQSEEQEISQSTVQVTSNKKRSRCQLCEATDNKTSSRFNVENLPYEPQEEATEMQFNSLAKDSFESILLESFWVKLQVEYPKISPQSLRILVPFASTYHCETGFSALHMQHRSRLT